MKRFIILQLFVLTSISAVCQDGLKSSQLKANLILFGASASYEKSISKRTSLNFEASLNYGFFFSGSDAFGNNFGYTLAPALSIEGRHYYNLSKRLRKGKSIANNSGNFLSATLNYSFTPVAYNNMYNNPVVSITPSWGIQRKIGRRFSLETLLGVSFWYDRNAEEGNVTPAIGFKFGYVIF